MANPDRPFGLKPVRHLNGNPWNGMTQRCVILAAVTNAIAVGDPVLFQGTGSSTTGCPAVDLATLSDTNLVSGVVTAIEPDPDDLSTTYRSANAKSADRHCQVCTDPDVVFWIQDDGGAALDQDSIGLNAEMIRTHATTSTGISHVELDAGTSDGPDADASNQLLILALAPKVGNAFGVNAVWEVLINMHSLRTPALGV